MKRSLGCVSRGIIPSEAEVQQLYRWYSNLDLRFSLSGNRFIENETDVCNSVLFREGHHQRAKSMLNSGEGWLVKLMMLFC